MSPAVTTIAISIVSGLVMFVLNVVVLSFYVGQYKNEVDNLKCEVDRNRDDISELRVNLAAFTGPGAGRFIRRN